MKLSNATKQNIKKKQVPKKVQKPTLWGSVIKNIVRPPRFQYHQSQIKNFLKLPDQREISKRQQIVQYNDKKIILSIFDFKQKNNKIILYLHGNSSCCLEGTKYLKYLPKDFSLATFDFIGCGNNHEDDKITLGKKQSEQIGVVSNFLRENKYCVYLWGRSMGAASALLYGKADVIVADSPFRSAKKLFKQMVIAKKHRIIPNCLVSCVFPFVFFKLRSDIKTKAQYDLQQLNIENAVKSINPTTTIIFLSGDKDSLIDKYNSQKLFKLFPGKSKYLQIVAGNHNDQRPQKTIKKIMNLIQKHSESYSIIQQIDKNVGPEKNIPTFEKLNPYIQQLVREEETKTTDLKPSQNIQLNQIKVNIIA